MSKQTINIGASPNDGTGTPLRTSFDYTNQNFTELYTAVGPSGNNIVVPGNATITGALTVDTTTLVVNAAGYADRVGIGTATPVAELHVIGGANFSDGTTTLRAVSSGNVAFLGTTTTDPLVLRVNNIEQYRIAQLGVFTWSDGAGGTRMTLNSTGLGIGTASHSVKLGVDDTVNTFAATFRGSSSTNFVAIGTTGFGASINAYTAGFAASADLVLQPNGSNVGIGVTPGAWGSTYRALQIGAGSSIAGVTNDVDLNLTNNARFDGTNWKYLASSPAERYRISAGTHFWYNAASGTGGNNITWTQAMTLDGDGVFLIGLPTSVATNSGSFIFSPGTSSYGGVLSINHSTSNVSGSGFVNFNYNVTNIGSISQNGTTGVLYNIVSDYRLKESIVPLSGGLARVNALKPSVYNWKSDGSTGEGFLAHELAEVVPFAVTGEKDAVDKDGKIKAQGIDMSRVVPILVAAIQELTARVQTLEAR